MAVGTYALTTLAHAKEYLNADGSDDALIERLVDAATDRIETYCGRRFRARDYSEWYDGPGAAWIALPEYPIQTIDRVSIGEVSCLNIKCDAADTTEAYVSVSSLVLYLYVIQGAAAGTTGLDFATYTTLTTMAAAINAASGGWTADIWGDYGDYRSAILRPVGRLFCHETWATLHLPDQAESGYRVDYDRGIILLAGGMFASGRKNIYIEYNAGDNSYPEDLEQVCLELTKRWYDAHTRDLGLKSEKLETYAYTLADVTEGMLPRDVQLRLDSYREIGVG